jgi:predicted alpha/beta-fold hydrolase
MSVSLLHSVAAVVAAVGTFTPRVWLSNAHLQSILPSLSIRRPWLIRRARRLLTASADQIVNCGDGVRLLGHYSSQESLGLAPAKEFVILLHGWEGSADSIHVLSLGSYLFDRGCDVFRLNFRDHGPSHHLNEDIFHSCRLAEVVGAVREIQRILPQRQLTIAGFSLGGNFALRVAAQAAAAGIQLQRAIAFCPVLRPHSTMDVLENGSFIYREYFIAKWKQSLRLKQQLFPERFDFATILEQRSIKAMTEILVQGYSEFANLDAYLNGYAITGDVLASLAIPSHILCALDDPIIPANDLSLLARTSFLEINAVPNGGHCGFMDRFGAESWADREVARLMGLP